MKEGQMVSAVIQIPMEQLAELVKGQATVDRHAAMVERHGEACTKATAAKIISCSPATIRQMLEDGRIASACGGERVDVRSLADYIEDRGERDRQARMAKKGRKKYV